MGAQVRHREGFLRGCSVALGSPLGVLGGASGRFVGGPWGFLGGLLLSWLRFGGSLGATWGLQGVEKRSFGNSGCQLEFVLAPKEPPGPPENAPKRAQEAPKSTLKSIVKCKTLLYQTCGFSSSKMKILRVGGPAWELKIDAERVQDKETKISKKI